MTIEELIRWHTSGRAIAEVQLQAERALDRQDLDAHARWGRAWHKASNWN